MRHPLLRERANVFALKYENTPRRFGWKNRSESMNGEGGLCGGKRRPDTVPFGRDFFAACEPIRGRGGSGSLGAAGAAAALAGPPPPPLPALAVADAAAAATD